MKRYIMAQRTFSTDFAGGTVSCTITLEGYKADELPEMLDNTHRVISKQIYNNLIPHLNEVMIDHQAVLPGTQEVKENLILQFVDHTVTLSLTLDLDRELVAPHKETISFLIANTVFAEVIKDMIGRLSGRLFNDTGREYYKANPHAAPEATSLRDILAQAGPGGAIIGMGSPFGGPGGERLH